MKKLVFAAVGVGLLSLQAQPQPYPQQPPYTRDQPYQQPPYTRDQPYQQPQNTYPQQPRYPQPGYSQQQGEPVLLPPQQLDQLVGRVALYPDPLLAQVLTAATFYYQIPDAANWAYQHTNLSAGQLARAIQEDNLPWDPSVLSLLPFASTLSTMARDLAWTQTLGNALLAQRAEVMDAVQRQRQVAYGNGFLQSNSYETVVAERNYIQVLPVNDAYIYPPIYDPYIVYGRPRPGFFVGGAVRFGPAVTIGSFLPFGWRRPDFDWRRHDIVIDNRPWERTWVNRQEYVHPYVEHRVIVEGPRVEHHEVRPFEPLRDGREGRRDEHRERH